MLKSVVIALTLMASPALAQPMTALRGAIDSVSADGAVLQAHSRTGGAATVRLLPTTRIVAVVPAALGDLNPGAYIGVAAAAPDAGGALVALEVHIFPESMRGVGEGFRPFDLAPGSTMTNGALAARVETVDGPVLTVSYAGGEQKIRIVASTKIVALTPGERSELRPGAAITARGQKEPDGALDAVSIAVGRDGLVPPM